ncbi:hypothetical protein [Mycobacterium interjectum]|uniref:hypothetical protein n=1 Tax=Mycobacterium interjectum TaxID=33895 RepID=UPI0008351138|nr:hypothetical protein [Mycobacterium interjectum]
MADDEDTGTQSFVPDFDDDTGTQSFVPNFDDEDDTGSQPAPEEPGQPGEPASPAAGTVEGEAGGVPVQPVTVPGRYLYLKWWQLVLVLFGVWMVSAVVGLGLFYWWYHSLDKTATAFAVLLYVVACAVGGVMLAMAQGRALLSALSVAVMSGPFASVAAAAPLYGYYFCERTGHCLIGVIPY